MNLDDPFPLAIYFRFWQHMKSISFKSIYLNKESKNILNAKC